MTAVDSLPWLCGMLAVAFAVVVLPHISLPAEIRDETEHDASPGTVIPFPKIDIFGDSVDPKAETLLVVAGSCSSCTLKSISPSRLEKSPMGQVAMVFLSSRSQLRQNVKRSPRVRVIADAEGRIAAALGTINPPRFYRIREGRLQEVWKLVDTWPKEWAGEGKG